MSAKMPPWHWYNYPAQCYLRDIFRHSLLMSQVYFLRSVPFRRITSSRYLKTIIGDVSSLLPDINIYRRMISSRYPQTLNVDVSSLVFCINLISLNMDDIFSIYIYNQTLTIGICFTPPGL